MAQKRTQHIPEGSSVIQEKFINYIMHAGKKTIARTIFKDMLREIEQKGNKNPLEIFEKAIDNAKPNMEVRPRRIGGAVYQIPVEVKPHRQMALSFRWIIGAARARKGNAMSKKLAQELLDAMNNQGAAIKKKEDTHKMAQSNKAFAHLAKYQNVK